MLSRFKKDQLGMPRVQVDWRLGEQVRRSFTRTIELIGCELQQAGVADFTLDAPASGTAWTADLVREGTWHHMGTTRMHDSPAEGVVDRNCRVHGMSNLYIAGSSVFPTPGANFPTITIAALAFRLSEHMIRELNTPHAYVAHNDAELIASCAA
jgi:choline dehydrogenase-like flavoprotein